MTYLHILNTVLIGKLREETETNHIQFLCPNTVYAEL